MVDIDLVDLIKSVGYLGIFTSLLLENGVLIFFFLPGDSLLLTAGFLASQGVLDIHVLAVGSFIVAILGYMVGYHLGIKYGLKLFDRGDTRFLKQTHLVKARDFYKRWGNLALVLARFLPLRSFVCFLAGVTEMKYSTFMFYNIVGAFLWAVILPWIGFALGHIVPIHDLKILSLVPIIAVLGTLLAVPAFYHFKRLRNGNGDQKNPD